MIFPFLNGVKIFDGENPSAEVQLGNTIQARFKIESNKLERKTENAGKVSGDDNSDLLKSGVLRPDSGH